MKLSIIIPVFNEEKTIADIMQKIVDLDLKDIKKELVVVDDGSKDTTAKKVREFSQSHKLENIHFFHQEQNQGKGAAVISGIAHASGDYCLIQDADLEYNPEQIKLLLSALSAKKGQVIYGTRLSAMPRFSGKASKTRFLLHFFGNRFLSLITSVLYGQWITDMETCYKLFPRKYVEKMPLHARGFEFEPEITAKLLKKGLKIYEVPITTTPRGYKQGKKLNTFRDGIKAVKALLVYRFTD